MNACFMNYKLMKKPPQAAGQRLYKIWNKLHDKPFGKWLFGRVLAFNVPYSDSIKPKVTALGPGYCRAMLKYRRKNTNHLNSVHALATANLGELVSGLAMLTGLPDNIRGIVTRIDTEYLKKARGDLMAKADVVIPEVTEPKTEYQVQAHIFDAAGDEVTRVTVTWFLSPITQT
jgi:acyl-coenzyme A thioesterase PaaI-like protein